MSSGANHRRSAGLILTLLCVSGTALSQTEIYKYTDEDGNVSFSDRRPVNPEGDREEKVELQPTNSAMPPADIPALRPSEPGASRETAKPVFKSVITHPGDQSTIPMGPGNFTVMAQMEPPLRPGEGVILRVDGSPTGEPKQQPIWHLTNIFRGSHELVVERVDSRGAPLHQSSPVTVYVLRPSVR